MPEDHKGSDWQVPAERFPFTRVLANTSPHMRDNDPAPSGVHRGADVSRAQQQLGRNRTGVKFYEQGPQAGDEPGVFGPKSEDATKKAQRALGYPDRLINGRFDALLSRRLLGQAHLPPLYRRRRRKRLEAAAGGVGRKAVDIGRKKIGTKESPPYSNNVLFTRWYGFRGPWCAMFVTWCLVKAGSKAFRKGSRFASCIAILDAAQGPGSAMDVVSKDNVTDGDLVLYHFEGEHAGPNHVGFFVAWINKAAGTFKALEGNTSPTSNANGGIVMMRTRSMSDGVVAFVRVNE